jgi:hypothetical protein
MNSTCRIPWKGRTARISEYPAVERVMTFSAEENEHMLAINVQLGFRPAGYDGEWQKRIK